jgi:hypothetical protein
MDVWKGPVKKWWFTGLQFQGTVFYSFMTGQTLH